MRAGPLVGVLVAGTAAAAATRAALRALDGARPGGDARWVRTNHRGRQVSLAAGPALAAGAAAGACLAPGLPPRSKAAALAAGLVAGGVGAYDDLVGTSASRGFRGHLGALARGEVTSGVVKIAGIGAGGLLAAALVTTPARDSASDSAGDSARRCASSSAADALLGGAVVAGSANLLNLLDLRPGRAIKAGMLHAPLALVPGPAAPVAAAALGAAAAVLPDDLGERVMLGDAGANALGACLGLAAVARSGRRARLLHLAGLVALTAASEKVSFTQVIERTPWLRRLDDLGRLPAAG